MNNKLKTFSCIAMLMLIMSACSNPVDSVLNKAEVAISRYEKKAENKKATAKDFEELQTEMKTLTLYLKDNVAGKNITPKQEQRAQQLAERYEKIMINTDFDEIDENK